MTVQFPVFLCSKDSGEVSKFDSLQAIQFQLERIDVENHEYEAWDSNGTEVILSANEPAWPVLTLRPDGNGPDGLRTAVLRYARSVGLSVSEPLSLDAIGATIEQIRNEQERKLLEKSPIRRFFARFR
jgi:hypothetical protein